MEFNQSVITAKGRQLMAKVLAGKSMSFSKIALSSSEYPQGQLESLTALTNIKQMTTVQAYANNEQTVSAVGAIENTGLTEGYFINTVGLYAIDPDLGEILYSVATAKQNGYIPPDTGVSKSGVQIKVYTEVANASKVDLTVDPASYATQEDIERFKDAGISKAYAWSEDGSDRLILEQPNRNIATTTTAVLTGNNTANQTINFTKYTEAILPNEYISIQFELDSSVEPSTLSKFSLMTNNSQGLSDWYMAPLTDSQREIHKETKTIKVSMFLPKGAPASEGLVLRVDNYLGTIRITNIKVEKGKTLTMRTTPPEIDYANSKPPYVGIGLVPGSTKKEDYKWSQFEKYRLAEAWCNAVGDNNFRKTRILENLVTRAMFTKSTISSTTFDYTSSFNLPVSVINAIKSKPVVSFYCKLTITAMSSLGENPQIYFREGGGTYVGLTKPISVKSVQVGDVIEIKGIANLIGMTSLVNVGLGFYDAKITVEVTELAVKVGNDQSFTVAPADDKLGSIMKYHGVCRFASNNYYDYVWSQSDEYRDYKEEQLKNAIVALGGTL